MELAFVYAIISTLLVSFVSLIGIFTLSVQEKWIRRFMHVFIGLAAGALLGDAFIHLIPEVFESGISSVSFATSALLGIIVFLFVEKYLHLHHEETGHEHCAPGEPCVSHEKKPLGTLVLFGDGIHNFVDGAIIAASYLVSVPLGIATTVAVFLHEVPQEISDFALLLHSGFSRAKALFWNFMSALVALVGAFLFFILGDTFQNIEPFMISFTAGGFIYIAAVNLIPELQKTSDARRSTIEFTAVLVGIALMFALLLLE